MVRVDARILLVADEYLVRTGLSRSSVRQYSYRTIDRRHNHSSGDHPRHLEKSDGLRQYALQRPDQSRVQLKKLTEGEQHESLRHRVIRLGRYDHRYE